MKNSIFLSWQGFAYASQYSCHQDASNYRQNHPKFSPQNILDEDNATYWATDDNIFNAELVIDLGEEIIFDRVMLQEPIRFGQRIAEFSIEGLVDNQWTLLANGTTIGYKRLLRFKPINANKIRINIIRSNNIPAISNFGLYKASDLESRYEKWTRILRKRMEKK